MNSLKLLRFETLTLVQTRKISPLPIILVGREFWSRAVDIPYLVEEGVIDPEDEVLFCFAETSEEILQIIADWYTKTGEPFIEKPTDPSPKTKTSKTQSEPNS